MKNVKHCGTKVYMTDEHILEYETAKTSEKDSNP